MDHLLYQQIVVLFHPRRSEVFSYLTVQRHLAPLQTMPVTPGTFHPLQCHVSALTPLSGAAPLLFAPIVSIIRDH